MPQDYEIHLQAELHLASILVCQKGLGIHNNY